MTWSERMKRALIMALMSFSSGLAISAILFTFGFEVFPGKEQPTFDSVFLLFISGVLIAPLFETLLILFIFHLLRTTFTSKLASYVTAIIMVGFHVLIAPLWGVVIAIPFLIFTRPFRVEALSTKEACLLSALSHALHNAAAIGICFLFSRLH